MHKKKIVKKVELLFCSDETEFLKVRSQSSLRKLRPGRQGIGNEDSMGIGNDESPAAAGFNQAGGVHGYYHCSNPLFYEEAIDYLLNMLSLHY